MSARVQAVAALLLALGLHAGVFALRPDMSGAVSAGAGGAEVMSLAAADAGLVALVAEWDRPPDPGSPPPSVAAPAVAMMPPVATILQAPSGDAPVALPPNPAPEAPHTEAPARLPTIPPPPPPQPDLGHARPEPRPEGHPVSRTKPRPETQQQRASADPAPSPAPAKPAGPAVPDQRAAGAGGGAQAGVSGSAQAATLSQARRNEALAGWGAAIRSRIERRKAYPSAARGASGTVTVRLTVSRGGTLAALSVIRSSGHVVLDQAALQAVQRAGRFPAAPAALTDPSYVFTLPITYAR